MPVHMKPFISPGKKGKGMVKTPNNKSPKNTSPNNKCNINASQQSQKKRKRELTKSGENTAKADPRNTQRKVNGLKKHPIQLVLTDKTDKMGDMANTTPHGYKDTPVISPYFKKSSTSLPDKIDNKENTMESTPMDSTSMSDIMCKIENMSKMVDGKLNSIENKLDITESKVESTEQKIEKTLNSMQKQLETNENRITSVEKKINSLAATADNTLTKIETTDKEVGELKSSVDFTQNELDILKNEVNSLKAKLKEAPKIPVQTTHKCPAEQIKKENQVLRGSMTV
jgi:chromosome segregation ATPase